MMLNPAAQRKVALFQPSMRANPFCFKVFNISGVGSRGVSKPLSAINKEGCIPFPEGLRYLTFALGRSSSATKK